MQTLNKPAPRDATVGSDTLSAAIEQAAPLIEQRYSRALTPIAHRFDVDDLYQVTAMRAYSSFSRCKAESVDDVRNWVMKIAANAFRTAIATHKGTGKRTTLAESGPVDADLDGGSDVDEATKALLRQKIRQMLSAIDRLPRQRQRVLLMKFIQQRSYTEIASELGITVEAARTSVCQALASARIEMQQYSLPGFED